MREKKKYNTKKIEQIKINNNNNNKACGVRKVTVLSPHYQLIVAVQLEMLPVCLKKQVYN